MKKFTIERITEDEMKIIIDWAAKEGWNPGLHDGDCFYQADPHGFFAGKLNGEIIAVGSAVIYDENFAFCGLYIVKPEYRNQGFGIKLTEERLNYVANRTTGIDGVLNMTEKYTIIGYTTAHKNIRFMTNGKFNFPIPKQIVDLNQVSFQELQDYDRRYFPAPRPSFLQCWISQPKSFALGYLENKKLAGYGVIRKCQEGYKIGPLFADHYQIAEILFQALLTKAQEPPFYLDIPEPNVDAKKLVKQYQMSEVFATARMYRNGQPNLDLSCVYGITSFELG
jgi:GNAT superfamily N-acetyltransferase